MARYHRKQTMKWSWKRVDMLGALDVLLDTFRDMGIMDTGAASKVYTAIAEDA